MAPIYCVVKLLQKAAHKRLSEIESVLSSFKPIEIPSISESTLRCRVCLKDNGSVPIFPKDGSLETQEAIRHVTGLPLSADDGYPKHLCEQCHNLLRSAILFRETANKSYKILTAKDKVTPQETIDSEAIELTNATKDNTLKKEIQNKSLKLKYDTVVKKYFDEVESESLNMHNDTCEREYPDSSDDDPFYSQNDSLNKITQNKSSKLKHDSIMKKYFDEVEIKDNGDVMKIKPFEKDFLVESKVQCRICSKVVKQANYHRHYVTHVPDSHSSHICDVCGKCFRNKKNCDVHRTTHSTQFPFKCEYCPYRGRHSGLLRTHMRTHDKEYKHKCKICSAKFINSSNLIRHSYTHKEPTIQCTNCNKKFHTQSRKQKHFETNHLGIRNHVCSLCGATFGFRRGLRKHEIKVHKSEKKLYGRLPSYLVEKSDS